MVVKRFCHEFLRDFKKTTLDSPAILSVSRLTDAGSLPLAGWKHAYQAPIRHKAPLIVKGVFVCPLPSPMSFCAGKMAIDWLLTRVYDIIPIDIVVAGDARNIPAVMKER